MGCSRKEVRSLKLVGHLVKKDTSLTRAVHARAKKDGAQIDQCSKDAEGDSKRSGRTSFQLFVRKLYT